MRPEWPRLEQALQRLHRLDQQAMELLKQRSPAQTAQPASSSRDAPPPSEDDSRQPRRRRTVTGYHGTHGDAILGILRRGAMQPARGMIWLNTGDYRHSYQHGGDRRRHASFVAEIQVTFDPSAVREERRSTPLIPNTLVLHSETALPATVTRVFRRSRTEHGVTEDVLVGATAIEAALR